MFNKLFNRQGDKIVTLVTCNRIIEQIVPQTQIIPILQGPLSNKKGKLMDNLFTLGFKDKEEMAVILFFKLCGCELIALFNELAPIIYMNWNELTDFEKFQVPCFVRVGGPNVNSPKVFLMADQSLPNGMRQITS